MSSCLFHQGNACWMGHISARLSTLLQAKDAARVASEFVIPVRARKMEVRVHCKAWHCHSRQGCYLGTACAASAEGTTA